MRFRLMVLAVLLPLPLLAQGRPPAVIKKPYVTETVKNFAFRAVEDDAGGFYLIWTRANASDRDLIAQHFDAGQKALWDEPGARLVSGTQGIAWDAVADGKGGLLLAWMRDGHVFGERYTADGKAAWPERDARVNVSTNVQTGPSIAPDGAGGAYLVWQEKIVPDRGVLFCQHRNAMGAGIWPGGGIRVSLRPSNQRQPRAVFDGKAGVVIAWQDYRESASQLQAQRIDYQGNRVWGMEGQLITAPSGHPDRRPDVGAVGGGSAVFAWLASSSAANRIFLQLLDLTGKTDWMSQGLEVSQGSWAEWNPVLHGDGEGGTWVGWEDYRNATNWQVYAQHFHVDGKPLWQAGGVVLASVQADQGQLSLADNGQRGLMAAWVDNRFGTNGVYWQAISPEGEILLGPMGRVVADQLIEPKNPQILALNALQAVISWADQVAPDRWNLHWKQVQLKS
jgi:hypothetical protein